MTSQTTPGRTIWSRNIADRDLGARAMLWSGGIGDFAHYLAALPGYLKATRCDLADVTIFVEATSPANVAPMLAAALGGAADIRFTPPEIHWTRTNPLLDPRSSRDWENRPARALVERRVRVDADWCLPPFVRGYRLDPSFLLKLAQPGECGTHVVVSARDKGLWWWPCAASVAAVADALGAIPYRLLGTTDESKPLGRPVETLPLVDTLSLSLGAALFIGTDTGLATVRELLGLPNLYCVSEYWWTDMLLGMGYLDEALVRRSGSARVDSLSELIERVQEWRRACV